MEMIIKEMEAKNVNTKFNLTVYDQSVCGLYPRL